MLLYHRGNIRHAPSTAAESPAPDISRPDRDSFLPWFMVMVAIALFVIFERQVPALHGTPILWDAPNLEGTPLGIGWENASFRSSGNPNSPEITTFEFLAKNLGTEEILLKTAYIISSIDSTKIQLTVSTPPGSDYQIDTILPVPPNAWLTFMARFPTGSSESAFLNRWSGFRIVIEYDGTTIKHYYDRQSVMRAMTGVHPEAAPHISPK